MTGRRVSRANGSGVNIANDAKQKAPHFDGSRVMTCVRNFLKIVDSSVYKGEFPAWDFEEDYALFGSMRVSGFHSDAGVALVFEHVECSMPESIVQSVAVCLATFPIPIHLVVGDAIFVGFDEFLDPQTEDTFFGTIRPTSRGRTFEIQLDKSELMQGGYLESEAEKPTLPSILFLICDTVPDDWLYSEPEFLIQEFEMGPGAKRLFFLEAWQHLSQEEVYHLELKPSSSPDIVALVEAVCQRNKSPKLTGVPNTSWRAQGRISP